MMEQTLPAALRHTFRHRTEAEFQRRVAEQQRQERERKERRDRAEDAADDLVDTAIAALTESEIKIFSAELDSYDEATVIALQENEAALGIVQDQIDRLLARAHLLPDGRRVFKTEDGLQVFDENGEEVDSSVIQPNAIPNSNPTWETYLPFLEQKRRLLDERADLLKYQADLDEARDRLDSGDMMRDEYEELRAKLKDDMPRAVHAHLDQPDQDVEASTEIDFDLEITSDMLPTGMTPPRI